MKNKKEVEKVITSNKGKFRYLLTNEALMDLKKSAYPNSILYSIPRSTARQAGPPILKDEDKQYIYTQPVGKFRYFIDDTGHLRIGCRDFNRATSKKILKWAGVMVD